jgi:hypothetical protein
MLARTVVAEIQRLLEEGRMSQRAVAHRVGVSRGTVHAIAHGRRRDRRSGRESVSELTPLDGPVERCPGCGGKVQMPCLLCRLRAMQRYWALSPCGCS